MFSVGTLHDKVAEPVVEFAGFEGAVGGGAEEPFAVEVVAIVPTPLPQAERNWPAIARAHRQPTALRDLVDSM